MKKRDKRKRMRKKQEMMQAEGLQRSSGIVSVVHMGLGDGASDEQDEQDEQWDEQPAEEQPS